MIKIYALNAPPQSTIVAMNIRQIWEFSDWEFLHLLGRSPYQLLQNINHKRVAKCNFVILTVLKLKSGYFSKDLLEGNNRPILQANGPSSNIFIFAQNERHNPAFITIIKFKLLFWQNMNFSVLPRNSYLS